MAANILRNTMSVVVKRCKERMLEVDRNKTIVILFTRRHRENMHAMEVCSDKTQKFSVRRWIAVSGGSHNLAGGRI